MGRPPKHREADLLDAALDLFAGGGPGAVSMAAVARAAGAPSGSVYHRFPSRSALLADLWLTTVERFQEGFLAALAADGDPVDAGTAAAVHLLRWSSAHPREARLLLAGTDALSPGGWPTDAHSRAEVLAAQLDTALRRTARALGGTDALARVTFATVDLPYAAVRRALRSPPRPAATERLLERAARAALAEG